MNKSMNCKVCGKEFIYRFKPSRERKYCSVPCQIIGQKLNPKKRERGACKFCSMEFVYNRHKQKGIYCSKKCKQLGSRFTKEQKLSSVKRYFEKHIIKQDNCWGWTGGISSNGYGQIGSGKNFKINHHRFSWILHKGEIPEGMHVLHHCDNRICSNPTHLFIGTPKDNMQDMMKKGRNGGNFKSGIVPHNKKTTPELEAEIKKHIGKMKRSELCEKFNLKLNVIKRIIKEYRNEHL